MNLVPLNPVKKPQQNIENLPGKTLYLTHLLALKKFRKRGNKDGALRAFQSFG